ncbi:MAG: MmgE/PrpD family protein [Oscillospiraceae bacterium]|nr:MmgE/PrpD family protein [Oscillospiraceae bacterium]
MQPSIPSISERIAQYYVNADATAIPEHVIARTKEIILDWLGNAVGGSNLESTEMVKEAMIPKDYVGTTTVVGGGYAPTDKAAFINAASAHGLEMDDSNTQACGHPAVVVISPAVAVGEEVNASGEDLIRAVIWGYDAMVRVGRAVNQDKHFERGFHPTATVGIFGGTTAVSMLKRFSAEKLKNALGIAGGFSAGNLECYADGTLTKRLNPGHASMCAITASNLADVGYRGPRWIFEGKCGFLHAYSDDVSPENMLKNLDYSEYPIMYTAFKPYASCKYTHAPIDCTIKVMKNNDIKADDIEKISVDVVSMAVRAVVEPREIKYNPPVVGAAQFSLPYSVAVAALYGQASVDQFQEELLTDPTIKAMMNRVEMEHTGKLDKYLPYIFASTVAIETKDGKKYEDLTTYTKGDPENPMSPEELKNKFFSLACRTVSKEKAQELYDAVMNLENISVRDLTALLH